MAELVKATPPEDVSQWKDVMVYCETFQNKLTKAAQEFGKKINREEIG